MEWLTALDFKILAWIRFVFSCSFLDSLMPKITFLGNGGWIWIFCGFLLLFIPKYRKYGLYLLAALLCGYLIGNLTLKPLLARERPCWIDTSVTLLIKSPTDFSFPSGHTLSSVIGASVLSLSDRRFILPATVTAFLIAFSRLYLYVHFPSDVLGGAMLGILIGCLVFAIGQRISRRYQTKHNG